MKINPKAVFIDLDGTLADSLSVLRIAYERFLKQFQRQPTEAEFNSLNGPPLREVINRLKLSHALKGNEEVLLSSYFEIIDCLYANVKPSMGAVSFLQKAKEHHCMIGIVTSNTRKLTQAWLETVCLSPMIDFIVSGEEVTKGKPYPEPYLKALKKVPYGLAEIVAIEDSSQGVQSAMSAGLKTFALVPETQNHFWPPGVELAPSWFQVMERLFIG